MSDRSTDSLTRMDIIDTLKVEVDISRKEASEFLEDVLEAIVQSLVKEEPVKIQKFGSLSVRQKKERMGRNPKTGVPVPIRARKVISFRASRLFKAYLNE